MAIFTGAGVAIVTPFNDDGSINYDKIDELIDFHCEHKTDSIVICGTTGESATMTEEEHMQCVKFTIDRVKREFRLLQEQVLIVHVQLSICRRRLQNMGQMVYFWLHLIIIRQHRQD